MSGRTGSIVGLWIIFGLAGCGGSVPVDEGPARSRIGDTIEISLADYLTKPRAELATLAAEWETKIASQEKAHREGTLAFSLLSDLHLPRIVPIFRQAEYSATAGLSLPLYVKADDRDSALAVHLAHYGDGEAARKLVEPGDTPALREIENAVGSHPYPLEWTRLAGLLLHAAQLRLATGDVDGATEIVALHRQLREVLDEKAAAGPLGTALLAPGREVLTRAARAWRSNGKPDLAEQAEAALANWGPVPVGALSVVGGRPRAELSRTLRSVPQDRLLAVASPLRAVDLFDLPFPDQGLDAVLLCFDPGEHLNDILAIYRPETSKQFPEPESLAFACEEHGWNGKSGPSNAGMHTRSYVLGGWECDVSVIVHGGGAGALIRLHDSQAVAKPVALARDFGGLHLDRSFEQTRRRLAPEQRADELKTTNGKAIAQVSNPVPGLKPTQLVLRKVAGADVVQSGAVCYGVADGGLPPLQKMIATQVAKWGAPNFSGQPDPNGGHLQVRWADAMTQHDLLVPFEGDQPVRFEITDHRGSDAVKDRERVAQTLDRTEREARLKAQKPLTLIPRQLEQIALGRSRAEILQTLPSGQQVWKRELPSALVITFSGEPASNDDYVLRQLFIRLNASGQSCEVRARYADGASGHGIKKWSATLLQSLRKESGAPAEEPSSWTSIWADLPPQKPAAQRYRWEDDQTRLTFERDAGGVEIGLLDLTDRATASTWVEHLPRGVGSYLLGQSRAELMAKSQGKEPGKTPDGALILSVPASSGYDVVLVWFQDERVSRIVARYAPPIGVIRSPAEAGQALLQAWSKEGRVLGWPSRQDSRANDQLLGLAWHDDITRFRLFWQESDQGPSRLFAEWKSLAAKE